MRRLTCISSKLSYGAINYIEDDNGETYIHTEITFWICLVKLDHAQWPMQWSLNYHGFLFIEIQQSSPREFERMSLVRYVGFTHDVIWHSSRSVRLLINRYLSVIGYHIPLFVQRNYYILVNQRSWLTSSRPIWQPSWFSRRN